MSLNSSRLSGAIVDALIGAGLLDESAKESAEAVWEVISSAIVTEIVDNAELNGVTANPTEPIVGGVG